MSDRTHTGQSVGDFWDDKYADAAYRFGTKPNAFLVDQSWRLNPGSRILCVGDGEGRNGVWLALQGHEVHSVDASPRAVQKATMLALEHGARLRSQVADFTDWDWPVGVFDAVVSIFVHMRPEYRAAIHGKMAAALAPGGWMILEAFSPAQMGKPSGGPQRQPEMLYSRDTVATDFAALEPVLLEATDTELREGSHEGPASVVRFIGHAPA